MTHPFDRDSLASRALRRGGAHAAAWVTRPASAAVAAALRVLALRVLALLAPALLGPALLSAQELPFGPNALVLGASRDAALCGVDLLDPNASGMAVDCGRPEARFRMVFPPTVTAHWYSNGPDDAVGNEIGEIVDGLDNDLDFEFADADRRAIIDGIPDGGWDFDGRVSFPLVTFVIGRFGLEVSKTLQVEGTLPRDMVTLLLEGRSPDRDDYDIEAFDLSALLITRYTAGYYREMRPGWTVGASASLHTGTINGYYEAGPVTYDEATGAAVFDITGGLAGGAALEGDLLAFRLPDGAGFSLDLGTRFSRSGVTLAVAVENLLSGMWWPERTLLTQTNVRAATDGDLTVEASRDTIESPTEAIRPLRDGIAAYRPATRIRTAAAYRMGVLTVGIGHVLEPGDGLLYATGDGWDLGVVLQPWRPLGVQASVGHWRDQATVGAGLSLALGSFLFQGGVRRSDAGSQAAFSIGLLQ